MPSPDLRNRAAGAAPLTDLAARFAAVRAQTARLAAPLSAEDCALQSMPDASPVKWHLAHTTWFFETFVLERFRPGYRAVRRRVPRALQLVLQRRRRQASAAGARPALAARSRDGARLSRARRRGDAGAARAIRRAEAAPLIELGLHHEQQHQELILTDLKHLLVAQPDRAGLSRRAGRSTPVQPQPLRMDRTTRAGSCEIGHDGAGFAFDNETPRHASSSRRSRSRRAR